MKDKSENAEATENTSNVGFLANRRKAARVRAAIRAGRKETSTDELNTITNNLHDILERLNRISPDAYAQVIKKAFNGNRSTLSKFTNPEAKDRRTKITSYLDKVEAISKVIEQMVPSDADKSMLGHQAEGMVLDLVSGTRHEQKVPDDADKSMLGYQTERMVLDLVSGTQLAEEAQYISNSSSDRALDDLYSCLIGISAYIERETGLFKKFEELDGLQFGIYDDGYELHLVEEEADNIDSMLSKWPLMIRVPFIETTSTKAVPGTFHFFEPDIIGHPPVYISVSDREVDFKQLADETDLITDPWFKEAAKHATKFKGTVEVTQRIYLVLRPNFITKRLKFYVMIDFVTRAGGVYWKNLPSRSGNKGSYEIKPSVACTSVEQAWKYTPHTKDTENLLIAWLKVSNVNECTKSEDFLGDPYDGTQTQTDTNVDRPRFSVRSRDYEITREDLDLFNEIEIGWSNMNSNLGRLFDPYHPHDDFDWDAKITTDLKQGSIAHALEYFFVSTTPKTGATSDSFKLPDFKRLAQKKADQLDLFFASKRQVKNDARDRLARIIDGQETLD